MPPTSFSARFPAAGLNRKFGYTAQPPFSTPDCLNVRPVTAGESFAVTQKRRDRGGSRPGFSRAYQDILGGGAPVRMLGTLMPVRNSDLQTWREEFTTSPMPSTNWVKATWYGDRLPDIYPTDGADLEYHDKAGAVRVKLPMDLTRPYTISIYIKPHEEGHYGVYSIFARLNDETPDGTEDGLTAELTMTGGTGAFSGKLKWAVGGSVEETAFTGGSESTAQEGIFKMLVDGTHITCFWRSNTLLDTEIPEPEGGYAGSRMGFGIEVTELGGICFVDYFEVTYLAPGAEAIEDTLTIFASANGLLYKENVTDGTLEIVDSTVTLASDRMFLATDEGGNLYIADYSTVRARGSDGQVNSTGFQLTAGTVGDWSALGIDATSDVVVITNAQGSAVNGTYKIAEVTADKLVLAATAGGTGTCSYRVERAPKRYAAATDSLEIWTATTGQVPVGCPCIALYRGRIVLAGAAVAPNVWYMSRQAAPLDWDFSQDDEQSAVAGDVSPAGKPGQPITALVPFSDDFLLIACADQMWMMRGDPASGGAIDNISYSVGIVGKKAWCHGPNKGEVIFLSYSGLYRMSGEGLEALSKDRLPKELAIPDFQRGKYDVMLEYDLRDKGCHIFIVDTTSGSPVQGTHWWWDEANGGFWPLQVPVGVEPTSILAVNSRWSSDSACFFGSRDGRVRAFRDAFLRDDVQGSTRQYIDSFVWYGPFAFEWDADTIITELTATLAESSKRVVCTIHAGSSAEAALAAPAACKGVTWKAGRNHTWRPRVRGRFFWLKLTSVQPIDDNPGHWGIEELQGAYELGGREKLL